MRCNRGGKGFTVVEVLLVITVLATLGSVGIVTAVNTQKSAREQKLTSDVDSLNSSVRLYLANGGSLDTSDPLQVIEALRVRGDSSNLAEDTSMGMRGSFVDPRLSADMITNAPSSQLIAQWNNSSKTFALARGGNGVSAFTLTNTSAQTTVARTSILKAVSVHDTNAHWIWGYANGTVASAPTGTNVSLSSQNTISPGDRSKLSPPTFTPPAGTTYSITNFAMPITIVPPSTGVGQVYYQVNSGVVQQYTGPVSVNAGDSIQAWYRSLDVEHWLDSDGSSAFYDAGATQLDLSLTAPSVLTYQQAGGAMLGGATVTPSNATATLTTSVPATYQSSSNFVVVYKYGASGNPLTDTSPSQGTWSSASIGLSPSLWGTASSLVVQAAVKAVNTAKFQNSTVKTATVAIQTMPLTLTLSLASGATISSSDTVTITRSGSFPAQSTIYYTLDGSTPTPGNSSTFTYSTPFSVNTTGQVTVKAVAYPETSYSQWFTSPIQSATYTVSNGSGAIPVGAIVNAATIQESAQFKGNLVLSSSRPVTNVTLYGSSQVIGNMYVPGTPPVYRDHVASSQYDNMLWSTSTDSQFSNYIIGRQFNDAGVETVPATETPYPRVKDTGGGSLNPTNYYVLIQDSAKVQGKVIRQYDRGQLASVSAPTSKTNSNSLQYDSWTLSPQNPNRITSLVQDPTKYSGANLVDANADVTFLAGNYGSVTASVNGATIILGDAAHPNVTQYYSFESLNISGGANIMVVGKSVITISSTLSVHDGGIVGNSSHPEWLQINFYTTQAASQYYAPQAITVTGGSALYAQVVAPNGTVTFENNSTFTGSVSAYSLQLKSTGVLFTLPPVTSS